MSTIFSNFAFVQAVNQTRDHLCHFVETGFQTGVIRLRDESAPPGEFDQRNAFLNGSTSDREEVFSVGLGEATVSLGEVGRDGQRGKVDQEVLATRKVFCVRGNRFGEIHGLLIDLKILEHESHTGVEEEQ